MTRYPTPDEELVKQGQQVFFAIDRKSPQHSAGDILNGEGTRLWRYRRSGNRPPLSAGNPFGKPDFVVSDASDREVCVIRRQSFLPSRFLILESERPVGSISLGSILRNRYRIAIHGAKTWTFRLTLFTVFFWGDADGDPSIWVRVGPSKMEWSVLLKPGVVATPLTFALAFIHNEWWNYS
jgi:hypothetical protein